MIFTNATVETCLPIGRRIKIIKIGSQIIGYLLFIIQT
nr:MAG TPA: hypothetical protein [Caudoviricetes sp.]